MPFMTPRGLKIRCEIDWAFTLLERLRMRDSRRDAFRVLKTCEAIQSVPGMMGLFAGVAASGLWYDKVWMIPMAVVAGRLCGFVLTQGGVLLLRWTGLLHLALVWSYLSGYGLLALAACVTTYFAAGWVAVGLLLAGLPLTFLAQLLLEHAFVHRRLRRSGGAFLSSAEVNFINAYCLHAEQVGIGVDLVVTSEELQSAAWQRCLFDYARKYPESVARFMPPGSEGMSPIAAVVLGKFRSVTDPVMAEDELGLSGVSE